MSLLTPSEQRGARLVALLLALGLGWELWGHRLPGRMASVPVDASAPATVTDTVRAIPPSLAPTKVGKVDLAMADATQLDALPGIGPVLAARIVAERERAGGFRQPEDLLSVPGIGPRLLERVRPFLTVGSRRP